MITTLIAASVVALQIAIVVGIILWFYKRDYVLPLAKSANIILPVLFIGSVLGSLYFSDIKGFEPCLLCWWQRIFIFGIALFSLMGDIRKSSLLRKEVLWFSAIGAGIAIFHNILDIFPTGLDVCGSGASCLARYVYEFGYITIPMMSLTVLTAGLLLTLLAKRYPQA